jgi:hypothetical protein
MSGRSGIEKFSGTLAPGVTILIYRNAHPITFMNKYNVLQMWRSIMSSSCCGGASKAEPTKVAVATVAQATAAAAEQPTAKSDKSECCNDKPAKSEKHGCGC